MAMTPGAHDYTGQKRAILALLADGPLPWLQIHYHTGADKSRWATRSHLRRLAAEGRVEHRYPAGQRSVWARTEETTA